MKLNNNNIERFDANKIVVGLPNVLWIEMRDNKIKTFDDLADFGHIKKLCILNFQGNPVMGDDHHKIPHLSALQNVMFHEKQS